jgi:hypothetical protein
MGAETITLQLVYDKLNSLEVKVANLEKKVIPEVKISSKEAAELEKIRQEIKIGKTISEKKLFSLLSK